MISENDRIKGEFYVDEAIKHVIDLGYHAKVFEIDRYVCWGTPKDYEEYQLTYEYWKKFVSRIDFSDDKIIPFTIGIAGNSGAGKTTLLSVVKTIIGEDNILILEGDGEHKWERESPEWKKFTHLDVDANNLYFQANNLQLLKKGSPIRRHEYDHRTGLFSSELKYNPKHFVVLCGLHAFLLPQNRKNLDVKIYMDVENNLRLFWKIKRDVKERGYDISSVIERNTERDEDGKKYIEPQKKYADIRIYYYDPNLINFTNMEYEEKIHVDICLKREDMICGYVSKGIQYLEQISSHITINCNSISFIENEVMNEVFYIYKIGKSIGIDMKKYLLTEESVFKGKDGIMAVILMCYFEEKNKY